MTKKVLIVDDSMVSRMMIREIVMTQFPDWECTQAASADKAIEACSKDSYDFITLDLNMPGRSGLEAAPEIIEIQATAKIGLLTANIQSATQEQATALGLSFVAKPINADAILAFLGS